MSHIIHEAFSHFKAGHINPAEYRQIYEATEPMTPTCATPKCKRVAFVVLGGQQLCAACALRIERKRVTS